jgi:hypothetical protein
MQDGEYTRPSFVGEVETPENLDSLTFGNLIKLSRLKDGSSIFYDVCKIVLDLDKAAVDKARAIDVVSFVGWVTGEVNRINKLFSRLSEKPTDNERKAGIDKLNFGLFGMVDRYARRMHIQNHDEVMAVPWIRVYQCLKMDNEVDKFQRRYMEETQNEYRRQNQRNRKR